MYGLYFDNTINVHVLKSIDTHIYHSMHLLLHNIYYSTFAKDHSYANPINKYFESMYLIKYGLDFKSILVYNFGMIEDHFKLKNKCSIFLDKIRVFDKTLKILEFLTLLFYAFDM